MFTPQLQQTFLEHRSRRAIEFPHQTYTFGELERAAERIAAFFQSKGVVHGERLILYLEAKEPFLLAYLGALWAGAVPVPLNPAFKSAELSYFVRDSRAIGLVSDSTTASIAGAMAPQCPTLRAPITAEEILGAQAPAPFHPPPLARDDPALILYSSGTTGEPKGVVHTQANLAGAVEALANAWQFTPDDVLANVLPLFHIHGLSFATNVSLLTGSAMLVRDGFHPTRSFDLIDDSTVFMAVPPYYYSFLKRPEFRERAARWTQLRLATCGSAPIRADVLPELQSILGRPVINRYGMTECHVLASLPLEGPWPHGSVGRPLAGIEVAVRSVAAIAVRRVAEVKSSSPQQTEHWENQRLGARGLDPSHPVPSQSVACAPGEVGRVFARGPNLFREYWGRPDATAQAFDSDGWFDTGDVGKLDSLGFLTLVDRSNDLIIVGGFNVYPAVVERLINECPGVRESAVVGVPDEMRGERVAAFVVADGPGIDTKKIRSFCRERLVDYQCPTWVDIVDELPRNTMGKVLKRELRERLRRSEGPQ